MEKDPITKLHEALWTLLEAHTPFTALVAESNRIKYTSSTGPYKQNLVVADMPEVRIVPVSTTPHLQRTSNGSSLVKRFEVQVKVGSIYVANLYELEWEIYRALATWATTLQALKWNDKVFVKLCRPTSISEDRDTSPKGGSIGWSCVWACEAEMWFDTADLKYVEPEPEP